MMNMSLSRIDSDILTLISPQENLPTVQGVRGMLSLVSDQYQRFVDRLAPQMEWNVMLQLTARPLLGRAQGDYFLR
jgi:hypothetical protein